MNLVKSDWGGVTAFLDSAVAAGAAPGAVLGISVAGNRFLHATGQMGADEPAPVTPSTVYDLASLTKVVGLVPAIMLAVEEGTFDLDAPINRYVPGFAGEGKEHVTGRLLLAHASGMRGWAPLFREAADRQGAMQLAARMPLESRPGTQEIYSDLGLILLTQAVESVAGQRLDVLLQQRIFGPLGMTSVGYLPSAKDRERIAPTELDPWR